MDSLIPVYCLSFANSDRRRRMEDRFNQIGLSESYHFQYSIPIDDPLLEYYLRKRTEGETEHGKRLASMTVGYLSMIKQFLSTDKPYGVFCEDDVHLRKNFKEDISAIIKAVESIKKPKKKPKIILLGFLSVVRPHFPLYDESIQLINQKFKLMKYPEDVWGAQMILLSRKNAMKIIEKYDRPFHLSFPGQSYSGDCSFTKLEPRALIYPMLGVEEGHVETKDIGQVQFHRLCHQVNYNKDEYI